MVDVNDPQGWYPEREQERPVRPAALGAPAQLDRGAEVEGVPPLEVALRGVGLKGRDLHSSHVGTEEQASDLVALVALPRLEPRVVGGAELVVEARVHA